MRFSACLLFGTLLACPPVLAVPPNTPIVNTGEVTFSIGGASQTVSAQAMITTDPAAGNSAPFAIDLDDLEVLPNVAGDGVGQLSVADPDPADSHVFAISDSRFEVVNGELRLVDGASLAPLEVVSVEVTATDPGGLGFSQIFDVFAGAGAAQGPSVTVAALAGSGSPVAVQPGMCATASGRIDAPAFTRLGGQFPALPGSIALGTTRAVKSGEVMFVQISDPEFVGDPAAIDEVEVLLRTAAGDEERVIAFETAIDSRLFVSGIQVVRGDLVSADCVLQTGVSERVTVTYAPVDGRPSASGEALVDPLGRLFSSADGQLVDGATVTLLDATSGAPALVFGDDGISAYPATVVTGGTVADAGGTQYELPPGSYRFPFVAPGSYVLSIQPPPHFALPSNVPDNVLQNLPGAPFELSAASRGAPFAVAPGPVVVVDVPLDVAAIGPTDAVIATYVAAPGGTVVLPVAADACSAVLNTGSSDIPLPAPVPANPSARFSSMADVLVVVTDADQNVDPFAVDRITAVAAGQTGSVQVTLMETGVNTGEFSGFAQLSTSAGTSCEIRVAQGDEVSFTYTDPDDAADVASTSGRVDPGFVFFSAVGGERVAGVELTLIDAATGSAASGTVFAADGVTPISATQISGPDGSVFFPVVDPGTYRISVVPPANFAFPSTRPDEQLGGGPWLIAEGARGADFVVLQDAVVGFDIPLDPTGSVAILTKTASSAESAIGDFIQYVVTADVTDGVPLLNFALHDTLPAGFRLRESSVRLNGDPLPSSALTNQGESVVVTLPTVSEDLELRYVVEVTAATPLGLARNTVRATADNLTDTNVATADVVIRDDLFSQTTFIVGRVTEGCGPQGVPVPGVRVLLEDGTYTVTDEDGRYHLAGVDPGSHVLALDPVSVPRGLAPMVCNGNSRQSGRTGNRFVDLAPGTLWQENFQLSELPPPQSEWRTHLEAAAAAGEVRYRFQIQLADVAADNARVTVQLDARSSYLPGSAELDGQTLPDPRVDGDVLTFRLGELAASSEHLLTYRVQLDGDTGVLTSRASARISTAYGQSSAAAVKNDVFATASDDGWYLVAEQVLDSAPDDGVLTAAGRAQRSTSDPGLGYVSLPQPENVSSAPYDLPEISEMQPPTLDHLWLADVDATPEMVWPPEEHNPRTPSVTVIVKHPRGMRPSLLVDGQLVDAVAFDGTISDSKRGVTASRWRNVPISETDSFIEAQIHDEDHQLVERLQRRVHFGGAPVRAEIVEEESYLVADGVHPPMLAVRLFDRQGYLARPGLTGEFSVDAPYFALDKARQLEVIEDQRAINTYEVRRDGIAFVQLEPTHTTGEVTLRFQFDTHTVEQVRARLRPGERDWVLVGLAEREIALAADDAASGDDRQTLHDGRVAFYAKGMISGQWLLTASYDTDKKREESIRQVIDPNKFYTLYGDGSEQRFDGESREKLYLKLERSDFEIEAGDFDTALNRGRFTSYDRRLTGVRTGYYGERINAQAWASETSQQLRFEVLSPDGTSGVYRLSSAPLLANSERISLVVRDRIQNERELSRVTLARHIDYTIDYDTGGILFRQPVTPNVEGFNPQTIEVHYELAPDGAEDDLVVGARVAYELDDQDSEVGIVAVDDASPDGGRLVGVDANVRVGGSGELRVEAATTERAAEESDHAWLIEYQQRGERVSGRAFASEQGASFGLGQQLVQEADTRKFGIEGEYNLTDQLLLRAEVLRQQTVEQGGERNVVGLEARYRDGPLSYNAGVQTVDELAVSGVRRQADFAVLGAGRTFLDGRIRVHGASEFNVRGESDDSYPSRHVLGAEYDVMNRLTLVAEHEIGASTQYDTQDTRFGLRSRPWTGGRVETLLGRSFSEDNRRLFATTGLLQQWRLNEAWTLDVGADRVQTIAGSRAPEERTSLSFNPAAEPVTGSNNSDFTAVFFGAGYRKEDWQASARVEHHEGDLADKLNLLAGASRQLARGRALSASLQLSSEKLVDGSELETTRLRLGVAWRPEESPWVWLARLDLEDDVLQQLGFDQRGRRAVLNVHTNRAWNRHQLSVYAGAKASVQQFDGEAFNATTLALGSEYRWDVTDAWDIGLQAGARESLGSGITEYTYGLSVGRSLFDDAWISVGYNVRGYDDDDFIDGAYRRAGPYLKFRLRVDQDSARRFLSFVGWRRGVVEDAEPEVQVAEN